MIILKRVEMQKRFVLSSLMLALLSGAVYATPLSRPDAGDNLREVQKQNLPLPAPSAPAPVKVEESKSKAAAVGGVKVSVKKVQVTGNTIYTSAELEALVNYLVGGEHALSDLDIAAQRITAFYRQNGYIVAHAYLPIQEVKDGLIRMEVLEGRVDKQRVENNSLLADGRVNDYLGKVKRGDVLKAEEVDRILLLLSDVPGVGSARAALQPGASVGTSDLVVELKPSAPYLASVDADNYGSSYTGTYRYGVSFTANSPTGLGDSLSFRGQMSNGDLGYWKVGYQIPVGDDGIRVGGTYSDSRYGLGKEFSVLGAYGSGTDFTLFGSYPFIRTQITNLTGTVTYQDKYLHDVTTNSFAENIKHVRLGILSLSGSHQDEWQGGGISSFDVSLSMGHVRMDPIKHNEDRVTAKASGGFSKINYMVNRLQRVNESSMLWAIVSGQLAGKNLNSSEKFSLGGPTGVRAFASGEAGGDEGIMLNLEWRQQLMEGLQGVLFYDAGSVRVNHSPWDNSVNRRTIAGVGIGANAIVEKVQIRASLGWKTHGTSTADPGASEPRLWVQMSRPF